VPSKKRNSVSSAVPAVRGSEESLELYVTPHSASGNAKGGKQVLHVVALAGGKQSTLNECQLGWNAGWRGGGASANNAYKLSRCEMEPGWSPWDK
jgi:hypothetical protein